MRRFHLIPAGSKWRLSGEGADRTLCDFGTVEEATARCMQLIAKEPGMLRIYDEGGTLLKLITVIDGQPSEPLR